MRRPLALLLLLLAVGPGAAAAATVVFSSNRSGQWRIWVVSPDGSGLRQLTSGEDDCLDVDPMSSPDGKSILFTSTRGGRPGLWRMAADGSRPARICDGDQGEWSPDGTRLAFRRDGAIWVRHLPAAKEKRISPTGWPHCSGPAWSPDGKRIAFAARWVAGNGLFIVAAAGGKPKKVYDKEGACEPHWSPDGALLVYETETHIWTIRPDGAARRLITWFGGVQRYARFSPDGKHIIFCQAPSRRGPWEIYVVPAGGGSPRRLTTGASDMYPHWK